MTIILYTVIVSFTLALILGFLLGFFKKIFAVYVDPLESNIREVLPGANCGACGYPGCDGYAKAVANKKAPVDACSPGGPDVAKALGGFMGVEATGKSNIAVLACNGCKDKAVSKGDYVGLKDCRAAKIVSNGTKVCIWGCMGFGNCVTVCKFDAIEIGEGNIPVINKEKCTGCGMCVKACPQKILSTIPEDRKGAFTVCSNRNQNKPAITKSCKVGCFKCGKCERACPKKAIVLTNGIPVVDYNLCDSCGDCVNGCPVKALTLLS